MFIYYICYNHRECKKVYTVRCKLERVDPRSLNWKSVSLNLKFKQSCTNYKGKILQKNLEQNNRKITEITRR